MGANRAGENARRKRKRHVKNLKTMWAAQDAKAAGAAPKKKATAKKATAKGE
jgi:hypothetical protein